MSQRVKRPNRSDDGSVPTKRRKRPTAEEEEAASLAPWHTRALNDFKIYNRTTTEAPAELFRKDLISAMKLPDSEPLAVDEYWVISDPWKQEWERGVQVPVNPDSLPEPSVTVTHCSNSFKPQHEFKLPKTRYIRITKDDRFKSDEHILSNAPASAEAACSYDLDECDVAWLKLVNEERMCMGMSPITEDQLERVLERLEIRCWDKIQSILRNEEGLGIEYDENVICDVCRSPDSEEGNEMVFCDSCNICVHQACYGITRIPEGQWLCCTCALSQRPDCVLCPNKGGAMKCTRSGKDWAHVSCALWIPEVSIGCVERMEPITKISSIPQSRWALICVLCRERVGACIQCSVKTCKTAYHVTCAFKHGLEMRAIIEDENADDGVKLRSYCEKHSKSSKKEKSVCSGSEDDDSKRRKRKDMTSEEKNQARAARLQEIESEFYKHVSIKDIVNIEIDNEALQYIHNYWKLKRKAGNNKPLLPPKSDDVDMLSHKQEQADIEKMKMFVQLRQDLERVRNLCYMVSRREKLSRTFFRMREQTFHKQAAVLGSGHQNLALPVVQAVIEANHGPSIYDRLYSHSEAEDHTADFEVVLARIAGLKSPQDDRRSDYNGVFKENNPYKKVYFNGTSKRRSGSLYDSSMSSASSSDERPKDKENRMQSSSEEGKLNSERKKSTSTHKRNTNSKVSERRQKRSSMTKTKLDSSSEEDVKKSIKDWGSLSKSRLVQMENELGVSGSDSDELMPIRGSKQCELQKTAVASIYSDSDTTDTSMRNDDKSSNAASDSQQSKMRTKAAVKEFSQKPSTSKCPNKNSSENKKRTKEETKRSAATKAKDYVPSDLIVPQRKAAKKASENMKSTTTSRVKEQQHSSVENEVKVSVEEKVKPKSKVRPVKENKEIKDTQKKESKSDIFDIDKEMDKLENQEILAYVPQRQAAKKATEHIKSLGKPGVSEADADKQKSLEHSKIKKTEPDVKRRETEDKPAKVIDAKRKSSSNSSTSSTSSSSTESSSSSTSDSEDEPQSKPQSESPFSAQSRESTKRSSAKDRPFLDKDAKSSATSSSSDSSDSSRPSTPTKPIPIVKPKVELVVQQESSRKPTAKPIRKSTDKKPTSSEREESTRIRGKGRRRGRPRTSNSGDRIRDANVRVGDISDSQCGTVDREELKVRKGKSHDLEEQSEKETNSTAKLLSPIRKTDKKLDDVDMTVSNLEKEILERKAGREGVSSKAKSAFDKLFRSSDKQEKSTVNTSERQKLTEKLKLPEKISRVPETSAKLGSKTQKPIEKVKPLERSHLHPEKSDKSNKKVVEKETKPADVDKKHEKAPYVEKPAMRTEKGTRSPEKVNKMIEKAISSPEKSWKSPEQRDRSLEKTKFQEKVSKIDKLLASPYKELNEPTLTKDSTYIDTSRSKNKCTHPDKIIANTTNLASDVMLEQTNSKPFDQLDEKVINIVEEKEEVTVIEEKRQNKTISQNRSIFSPQQQEKEADLFDEFDNILPDEFGIPKEDDILKNPMAISINNVPLFKEDSKEDSARETLNLVEKLRMEMSKKSTSYDVDDTASVASSIKNDSDRAEFTEQIVPNNIIDTPQKEDINIEEQGRINVEMRVDLTEIKYQEKDALRFISNDLNITNNDILPEQHQHVQHAVSGEADERWVPPSDSYPNIEQKTYNSHNTSEISPYLSNFESQHLTHTVNNVQVDASLSSQNDNASLPSQLDVPVDDEIHKSQSPNLQDRRVTQTPYLDPASMDCMPSPSPYADIHPQAKWADRHVMPNRRSSSSSAASTTSSPTRRNDVEDEIMKRQEMMIVNSLDVPYGVMPSFAPNPLEGFSTYSDQSQCVGPVSLFPPPNINNQLFPSPGAAMFPPPSFGAPFPGLHSMINPGPKPVEEPIHYPSPCTAAFTSSQHNMALTAAMVNPPQLSKESSQEEEAAVAVAPPLPPPPVAVQTPTETAVTTPSEEVPASPALSNSTPTSNHVQPSPNPSLKSNSSAGKKSPSKPTRTSARFLSQQSKSPSKSPGKSPRQESVSKNSSINRGRSENRRGVGKASTGRGGQIQSRGKGRGRGRGRGTHTQHNEYDHTIHNKLVGTVYDLDFDDDITSESMSDLRAMRERRKSVDLHDRKSETAPQHISRDSSQSPKFASPSQATHKSRTFNTDLRELRPPTPITDTQVKSDLHSASLPGCEISQTFQDIVQPVLPGPVDMRTYNSFDTQTYNESNLLGAFSNSGAPEQPANEEIDEDFEKELQSALISYPKTEKTSVPEVSNIKVSLSDSRNQLKVKIKGPIANYTSTVTPLPPTSTDITVSNITTNLVPNTISSSAAINPGTSNLRRMRKKELLRQYWTQNMNTDDPAATAGLSVPPAVPPVNRTIITIPKAVASMTSIPTKDDYRDYRTVTDDVSETKHRKENKARPGAMTRELRQLDIPTEDDGSGERRRSIASAGSNTSLSSNFDAIKRRGRPPRSSQVTPKLKIRISSNSIVGGSKLDDKKDAIRPPKKRLPSRPSVEDLKRESMKFRKQVMADFSEEKRKKKDKSGKKKKKKKPLVQIISNESANQTKLIIRFGKKTENESDNKRTSAGEGASGEVSESAEKQSNVDVGDAKSKSSADASETDPLITAGATSLRMIRTNKLTPIKLKLSRCQEGSGYIMATNASAAGTSGEENSSVVPAPATTVLNVPESVHQTPLLPLNKDCEVR